MFSSIPAACRVAIRIYADFTADAHQRTDALALHSRLKISDP
jgi:hypothetical protein